ncbi:hypothetical protein NAV11_03535 [Pseudomonas songnenensis]|uniref:Uncharacterized protein n=1 Tax=Pseudomonas songnenensis TaxID=1176259 RepID=A0ABX9V2E2_9PSED|nr:hypothetical protein [Pseudomonas songnenensis]MCQ4298978.1 hypothetical protein [Pseudomonas songnenensis]RMH99914.1 hypothetical protein EA798_00940 [Pseudomonas songnenensis]
MRTFFLLLWGLLSLTISTAALRAVWLEPSLASGFALLLVVYYIVCFFQLIRAAYLPWGLLGAYRRSGYWLCLILLPLTLIPLHAAYQIWEQGGYVAAEASLHTEWLHLLLGWLQDVLGYLGPLLVLAALGIGLALMLLRLLRGQVAR